MLIELFYIITAFIFLLYYSGIGLTRITIPERFEDYEILVIPFTGLSLVLFFAHIFGFIGLGSRTFTWIILAIVTPLNIYAVKKNGFPRINAAETFPIFFFATGFFLVGILPLFNEGYLTSIGRDAPLYTMLADHFLINGLTPPIDKGEWYTSLISSLIDGLGASRIGPMYFQSMIGAITGLEGYKTFTVLINLFHSMMTVSAYILVRGTGLLSRRSSFFAVILLGMNSLPYWSAIDGFFAQTMMMSIPPVALAASFHMLTSKDNRSLIFSIIICSAILMTSPESIILLFGPLFFFAVIKALKKELLITEIVKSLVLWASLLIIINILPLKASFQWLYNLFEVGFERGFQNVNGGNVAYYIPLTQVFGFTPPFDPLYKQIIGHSSYTYTPSFYHLYFYGSYAMVFIALLLIGYALLCSETAKRTVFISIFIPFFLMVLDFRFSFPYGYFKTTTSTFFITATLIIAGIRLVFSNRLNLILKAIATAVVTSIVMLSLISTSLLFDMVINNDFEEWVPLNRELIALRDSQYLKKGQPILLEEALGRGNKYYWIAYLLQDMETFPVPELPVPRSLKEKKLDFKHVIYPRYLFMRKDDGEFVKTPAEYYRKYQSYISDGWAPLITTSRYILLGKGKNNQFP